MSRVHDGNKFLNIAKHAPEETNPSKVRRYKGANADYTKASSLSSWLFLKYDMSYKTYQNKKRPRRERLREEYMEDTGNVIRQFATQEENSWGMVSDSEPDA